MMRRSVILAMMAAILLAAGCKVQQSGVSNDPVLFTVDKTPVQVSEFKYIYAKTNGAKADYSRASLQEYLALYTKFKLKVRRAKEMRLDTIPTLRDELAGYRKQLSDSYLIDREVTDKLIAEVYERSKKDVDIGHILVNCAETASPEDTLRAYQRAMEARTNLLKGESFDKIAMTYSDDPSKDKNKGQVGYVTALFPNGLYALETAAYSLNVGEVSQPIRTRMGYHLVKVNGTRPARGEMEAAHILIRKSKDNPSDLTPKVRIDSIYNALKKGEDFGVLASQLSEDRLSAAGGGNIGFFGINRYEKSFEDAAFALQNDADFTMPVETSVGWHIIKRIGKKGLEPFNIAKPGLQLKVKNDARFELSRKGMIQRIQKESGFVENHAVLEEFITTLDSNFLTFKWKPNEAVNSKALFSLGADTKATIDNFEDFLSKSARQRIRMSGSTDNHDAAHTLYATFVEEETLRHEERHLEQKYPDFKALMREYEEGILLFEAMRMEVWDKASQDTAGLREFFKTIPGKYHWKQRAVVSAYTIKTDLRGRAEEVRDFVSRNTSAAALAHFNTGENSLLTVTEKIIEEGKNTALDNIEWAPGKLTTNEPNHREVSINFMKIEKVLPAGDKTLEEARGYIVADYQDYLEKKWLDELRAKYKVEINQKVFDSLVKQ